MVSAAAPQPAVLVDRCGWIVPRAADADARCTGQPDVVAEQVHRDRGRYIGLGGVRHCERRMAVTFGVRDDVVRHFQFRLPSRGKSAAKNRTAMIRLKYKIKVNYTDLGTYRTRAREKVDHRQVV